MERLTWDEICRKYPAQWVGMKNVTFEEDGMNIQSAVVEYINLSKDDLIMKSVKGEIVARHTDPDAVNHVGIMGVRL